MSISYVALKSVSKYAMRTPNKQITVIGYTVCDQPTEEQGEIRPSNRLKDATGSRWQERECLAVAPFRVDDVFWHSASLAS